MNWMIYDLKCDFDWTYIFSGLTNFHNIVMSSLSDDESEELSD